MHWFTILKGFKVNSSLPTGGGKYGFVFGSSLPLPTTSLSLYSLVTISKEHKTLPPCSPSPATSLLPL